jgi:hypothetical protein
MASSPIFLLKSITQLRRWLRGVVYKDMDCQARDWAPEGLLPDKKPQPLQSIKLDFAVPRKHRLNWVRRRVDQMPR